MEALPKSSGIGSYQVGNVVSHETTKLGIYGYAKALFGKKGTHTVAGLRSGIGSQYSTDPPVLTS